MTSLHKYLPGVVVGGLLLAGSALAQGDDCSTGSPITGTGTWFWDNTSNTTSGFDGGDPGTCFSPTNSGLGTGIDTIRQDLFYVWTVPATTTGAFVFDTENSSINTDTKMSIHAGSDCNAVCIAADDDGGLAPAFSSKITLTGLVQGQQYLIQIGSWDDISPVGAGQLNITELPPPPANDTCATPDTTTLVGLGVFAYDTTSSFTSGFDGGGNCGANFGVMDNDIFFTWTAPAGGNFSINTYLTGYDTTLAVHAGSDCNATCVAYNDQAAGTNQSEVFLTGVTAGDQFLVQVGGWNGATGPGTLEIVVPPPPPVNDTCATPSNLVGTGLFAFDNTSAFTSAFDGGNTCNNPINPGIITSDVFYTWTAPAAGDYTINTLQTAYDTTLAVHSGNDCNATCLDFNDDANGTLQSELILTGLNAGDQLLIQVGSWNGGAGGPGTLEIATWVDPCASIVPDVFEPNDTCATPVAVGDGFYPALNVERTNQDFYSFTVPAGGTVNIVIDHLLADADIDGLLYDASVICHDTDQGLLDTLAAGYTTGDGENFFWDNTTGVDVDCILKVNIWPASTQGDCSDYDLTLTGTGQSGPTLFCDPANTNSSGNYVDLSSSDFSGPGVVHLEATGGPNGQFGYFLVSATALNPGIPVSQGVICVGAPQGRYNGVGGVSSIGQFNASGVLNNIVGTSSVGTGFDVPASLPNPPGGVITPGSTFHFQLWYRDGVNSNFSNGLTVVFP